MTAMRPQLKSDTFYLPVADGVYFRNNQSALKIKGKVIYRWMENLVPYLDGQHTLEEITEGLDPERRAMVTDLVTTLLTNHFLKDTSHDLPHTLSSHELETYAAEIAFIDSFCDSAAFRFERFRDHQVLVIGSGLTMTGLVHASLACGLRHLSIITTQECETNTRCYQDYLDPLHKGNSAQTLQEIQAPDWDNEAEVLALLQPFDTILHTSDRPMLARARLLNKLCVTHAKNLLQSLIVDDHAWIGPLIHPNGDACWECAWRRLQGNLTNMWDQFPRYDFQDHPTLSISRFVALPTAALVANRLSFELFKYVTEAGPVETRQHLIEVDLETLRSQEHRFSPHPLCSTCWHPVPRTQAEFLAAIRQLEQGEPLDQDLFSQQIAPYFEARFGLFSSLDEDDFAQFPLQICKAVVSNPMPQEKLSDTLTVLGAGNTPGASRRRAALQACEVYAASIVDRRRLPSREMQRDLLLPTDLFSPEVPLNGVKEWTWASDLQNGQVCLIPAKLAYPILHGISPQDETSFGIGSGMSWAEALSRGLLSICHYLTLSQLDNVQKLYRQVDLATTPLEPEGTIQRHTLAYILDQMDGILTVYDVTGPLQVPTFAFCLAEKTLTYSTQFDVAHALRTGLETTLILHQLTPEQLSPVPLPVVPNLPVALRSTINSIPAYEVPQEWPERVEWLQQVLQKNGWRAFAIPLDHDPILHKVHPYIVQVVLGSIEIGGRFSR